MNYLLISNLQWYDYLGSLGAALIIFSYLWLQLGQFSGQDITFSVLNILGAMFILTSLSFNFNFSAAIIEIFWLIISLLGLALGLKNLQISNKD